jgi:hydrogenase maturation protease
VLTVIGCGNLNRRDDGVGVVVAQRLDAALLPHQRRSVAVVDAGTDGMGVMLRAEGASALILVDASRNGSGAGAIHEVPGSEIESRPAPSFNLHDFRWDHALYAGRRMHGERFPRDVRVFLIEAADLSWGVGLSAPVERAAERVTELILARIAAASEGAERSATAASADGEASSTLLLQRGSLRLPCAVYRRYFAGLDSVLLMPRDGRLLILPIQVAGGGGHLLKVVNAAGDRAVSGIELFRALGVDSELIDGGGQAAYEARWSAADGALVIDGFFC